jgi:hypothetical protein
MMQWQVNARRSARPARVVYAASTSDRAPQDGAEARSAQTGGRTALPSPRAARFNGKVVTGFSAVIAARLASRPDAEDRPKLWRFYVVPPGPAKDGEARTRRWPWPKTRAVVEIRRRRRDHRHFLGHAGVPGTRFCTLRAGPLF